MILKALALASILGLTAGLALPGDAEARSGKAKRGHHEAAKRDCKPYNGLGYYGNPWCDGGWKHAEDYAPGTSPYYDVFDLPQVRRVLRDRH